LGQRSGKLPTILARRYALWRFRPRKRMVILMDANSSLTVRVGQSGSKYIWQLYRVGIVKNVKYSGPFYRSAESAMAAGLEARAIYLARLEHQKQRRHPS
jgi:hypothetical protein